MSDLLFKKIRSLLMEHWDPIGIEQFKNLDRPEDEYDSYARDLAGIVARGGTPEELEDYLVEAEDYIGVPRSKARIQEVARLLSRLSR
jgi:hypothetical protein